VKRRDYQTRIEPLCRGEQSSSQASAHSIERVVGSEAFADRCSSKSVNRFSIHFQFSPPCRRRASFDANQSRSLPITGARAQRHPNNAAFTVAGVDRINGPGSYADQRW